MKKLLRSFPTRFFSVSVRGLVLAFAVMLSAGVASAQTSKLDAGQTGAACNQLGAFINEVNAFINNGSLTPAEGQALIDAVHAVQADFGC